MLEHSKNIDLEIIKEHLVKSSDKNFITMKHLYDSKDFDWSLFIGHLVIEKLLKAYYIKQNNEFPPLIHNLIRLAELSSLELDNEIIKFLSTVTTFNINARYDDYKDNFHKICTKEYTDIWINLITDFRLWIKNLL